MPVNIQNRMALVANGTVDIECGSTVNTLGRQKQVDFTLVTFIAADRVMAKKGSGINEIEDLAGKVAIVPQASTSEKVLNGLIADRKLDIKVNLIRDHADALLAVETRRADAYVTDDIILYGLATKARQPGSLVVSGRALSYAPYGFMVPKNIRPCSPSPTARWRGCSAPASSPRSTPNGSTRSASRSPTR